MLAAVQRSSGTLPGKLLLFVSLCVCAAFGQGAEQTINTQPRLKTEKPPTSPSELTNDELKQFGKPIRSEVDLVLVSVTVTDPLNRLVTGLEKDNFVLLEQNIKQDIKHFSSEDAPISLGVVFDLSTSMKNKIDKAKEAVVEFFKTANPQDEFFMVTFADRPELLHDFTTSIEDIQGKLVYAVPKGQTALLDAVYLAMNRMRTAKHPKKALLIISDGGDNHSRYTDNEIKKMVQEADVQIYAIGIFDPYRSTTEEIRGPYLLSQLTDETGGRTFSINDVSELSDTAVKIGVELRNQYVLGYRPSNKVRDGKWRKVKVKLNAPKGLPILNVHARQGYYAPQQ